MKKHWGKPFADAKDMKQIPSIPSFPSSDPKPYMPQHLEVILPVLTKSAFTTSIKLARQATLSRFLLLKTPLCEKSHLKVSNILIRAKNSAKPNALRSGKSTITTVSHMMEGFLTILAESLNICYNYKLFPFCLLITFKVLKMSAKNHDCFGKVPFTSSRIQTQRAISLAVNTAFQL